MASVYFIGLVFDDTYGASQALNKVRAAQELGYTWIDDVAIIERHNSGRIATHTPHGSVKAGAAWGGLLGALVGIFFPPGGFLAITGLGAAGGAAIEKAQKESYIPQEAFDEIKDSLEKGTSALLVIGETTMIGEVEAAFATQYAREIKHQLDADQLEELKDKIGEGELEEGDDG
ncbi:MAG: DUF1269 domain-containing protein [Acidimicrobiia bacterium]|nr:DUF1269 domain-containing protein [Acidimicrobiia bacterium]